MIIVRLWGGIGNQLFQYSFGQYIEKEIGVKVFYDDGSFGTSDQLRRQEISSLIPQLQIKKLSFSQYTGIKNRLFRLLFQCMNTYISENDFDISLVNYAKGTIFLQGYWQEEKYAKHFPKQKILSEWETPSVLSEIENAICSDIKSVSIHVRRGDYFSPKNISVYGVCEEKYYEQAVEYVNLTLEGEKNFLFFLTIFNGLKNIYDYQNQLSMFQTMKLLSLHIFT